MELKRKSTANRVLFGLIKVSRGLGALKINQCAGTPRFISSLWVGTLLPIALVIAVFFLYWLRLPRGRRSSSGGGSWKAHNNRRRGKKACGKARRSKNGSRA